MMKLLQQILKTLWVTKQSSGKTPSTLPPSLSSTPYVPSGSPMKLSDHQHEFLRDVVKLLGYAHSLGWKVTGGELRRTEYQQREYIRIGKSKTMNSKHLKKCAIDLNFFEPVTHKYTTSKAKLQKLGDYWEALNDRNSWGGNWKSFRDTPHFQRNPD